MRPATRSICSTVDQGRRRWTQRARGAGEALQRRRHALPESLRSTGPHPDHPVFHELLTESRNARLNLKDTVVFVGEGASGPLSSGDQRRDTYSNRLLRQRRGCQRRRNRRHRVRQSPDQRDAAACAVRRASSASLILSDSWPRCSRACFPVLYAAVAILLLGCAHYATRSVPVHRARPARAALGSRCSCRRRSVSLPPSLPVPRRPETGAAGSGSRRTPSFGARASACPPTSRTTSTASAAMAPRDLALLMSEYCATLSDSWWSAGGGLMMGRAGDSAMCVWVVPREHPGARTAGTAGWGRADDPTARARERLSSGDGDCRDARSLQQAARHAAADAHRPACGRGRAGTGRRRVPRDRGYSEHRVTDRRSQQAAGDDAPGVGVGRARSSRGFCLRPGRTLRPSRAGRASWRSWRSSGAAMASSGDQRSTPSVRRRAAVFDTGGSRRRPVGCSTPSPADYPVGWSQRGTISICARRDPVAVPASGRPVIRIDRKGRRLRGIRDVTVSPRRDIFRSRYVHPALRKCDKKAHVLTSAAEETSRQMALVIGVSVGALWSRRPRGRPARAHRPDRLDRQLRSAEGRLRSSLRPGDAERARVSGRCDSRRRFQPGDDCLSRHRAATDHRAEHRIRGAAGAAAGPLVHRSRPRRHSLLHAPAALARRADAVRQRRRRRHRVPDSRRGQSRGGRRARGHGGAANDRAA